jgi:hypothetical protein
VHGRLSLPTSSLASSSSSSPQHHTPDPERLCGCVQRCGREGGHAAAREPRAAVRSGESEGCWHDGMRSLRTNTNGTSNPVRHQTYGPDVSKALCQSSPVLANKAHPAPFGSFTTLPAYTHALATSKGPRGYAYSQRPISCVRVVLTNRGGQWAHTASDPCTGAEGGPPWSTRLLVLCVIVGRDASCPSP